MVVGGRVVRGHDWKWDNQVNYPDYFTGVMESFFIAIPHDGLRRFRPPRFWGKRDHLETKFAPQKALKFIV
jgi:hypothetical protein